MNRFFLSFTQEVPFLNIIDVNKYKILLRTNIKLENFKFQKKNRRNGSVHFLNNILVSILVLKTSLMVSRIFFFLEYGFRITLRSDTDFSRIL